VLYINLNFDEIFKIKKMFYLKNYQISNHNLYLNPIFSQFNLSISNLV